MRWAIDVVVMPKTGVSDPQGEAVRGGLAMLGHDGVERVRVGRHISLEIEATDGDAARRTTERMAEQLLANPVIEMFTVGEPRRVEGA